MFRMNLDRMFDDNPQDAVGGTNAPSVARRYTRRSWTAQANHTWIFTPDMLNEVRFAYLNGDPVTRWEAQTLSTAYTRGSGNGAVPFTIKPKSFRSLGQAVGEVPDTLSWTIGKHYLRFGGSIIHHEAGASCKRARNRNSGTFTFLTTNAARNSSICPQMNTRRRTELPAAYKFRH